MTFIYLKASFFSLFFKLPSQWFYYLFGTVRRFSGTDHRQLSTKFRPKMSKDWQILQGLLGINVVRRVVAIITKFIKTIVSNVQLSNAAFKEETLCESSRTIQSFDALLDEGLFAAGRGIRSLMFNLDVRTIQYTCIAKRGI